MKEVFARVQKFLDVRAKMRGIDPEEISNLQSGSEQEVVLSVSDLKSLLEALNEHERALKALLRDVVPHVRDTGHNAADREMAQAIATARALVE